ncbi:DUF3231 family protein [Virgibacillus necropolis]|uniref:DUF3231 domain-containing protein n=1 Tax=Virgibacillus necropolis TaxID=163877 RepID=A0A221MFQ3_9BACI|nr:DUF3231 family protein [Virgibacillus necropolis]ASN06455.1 hypothetical protein CFK40_16240 [Virgibacillus necropolis]
MGILSGNPKDEPMHYGEVFAIWSAYSMAKSQVAAYEVLYNHAGDKELKKFISDMIQNIVKPGIEETEKMLKVNGVGLPPTPPERAEANSEDIPVGARIMDPEISATLSQSIAQGLIADSTAIGQSIREDIAMMFGQFHNKKVQMGGKLLQLNKEKGWLIPPPLHVNKTKEQ